MRTQVPRLYNYFHAQLNWVLIKTKMLKKRNTFFLLYVIYHANSYQNVNNCWHFYIYEHALTFAEGPGKC